jgi:hypothetical protein
MGTGPCTDFPVSLGSGPGMVMFFSGFTGPSPGTGMGMNFSVFTGLGLGPGTGTVPGMGTGFSVFTGEDLATVRLVES